MSPDNEILLERTVSAHRERAFDGVIKSHPAWHDLDAAGRRAVFDETFKQRMTEQALDLDGHSTTVRAILARITKP